MKVRKEVGLQRDIIAISKSFKKQPSDNQKFEVRG